MPLLLLLILFPPGIFFLFLGGVLALPFALISLVVSIGAIALFGPSKKQTKIKCSHKKNGVCTNPRCESRGEHCYTDLKNIDSCRSFYSSGWSHSIVFGLANLGIVRLCIEYSLVLLSIPVMLALCVCVYYSFRSVRNDWREGLRFRAVGSAVGFLLNFVAGVHYVIKILPGVVSKVVPGIQYVINSLPDAASKIVAGIQYVINSLPDVVSFLLRVISLLADYLLKLLTLS